MSPRVTRANSRQAQAAAPYFLRSRVPLGNASNLIGLHRGVDVPKRQKPARVKRESAKSKSAAEEKEKTPVVCDAVKQLVAHPELHIQPQCFSSQLLDIPDVDSGDAADAQMCSEYVRDIYDYLQQLEVAMAIRPCYLEGQEVTGAMRAVALNWLLQVQREFKLRHETFFMTVGIIDSYLQNNPVPKKYLQLVCVTAMLISSKYEEIYPPTVGDFEFVTDGAYTCGDIRRMERIILKRLKYNLGRPIPVHFLQRACKIAHASLQDQELGLFLLEVSVLDYDLVHVAPSLIAAAAFAVSQRILSSGEWSIRLQHHTGYSEKTLTPVMLKIQHTLKEITTEPKLQEINSRYRKVSSALSHQ